jgi:hypothetical protein
VRIGILCALGLPISLCAQLEDPLVTASRTLKGLWERAQVPGLALLEIAASNLEKFQSTPKSSSSAGTTTSITQVTTTLILSVSYSTPTLSFPSSSTSTTPSAESFSSGLADLIPPSTATSAQTFSPTPIASSTLTMSVKHRDLIIILSSVLGALGIALVAIVLCLTCRYKRGSSPFSRQGGVTPINDEEIDSWRNTLEQKRPIVGAVMSPHTPRGPSIDSIVLQRSPNWNWTPPTHTRNSQSLNSPAMFMDLAPDFLARAPNSRVGLTDEAIPGAEPYLPPVKRQSSRLSKAHPGHGRSKSRRSSMSAKSMWSYTGGPILEQSPMMESMPTWFDPDNESVGTALRNDTNSSPEASIFDGLVAGGLSPRPMSKAQLRPWNQNQMWDKETSIGRAIA